MYVKIDVTMRFDNHFFFLISFFFIKKRQLSIKIGMLLIGRMGNGKLKNGKSGLFFFIIFNLKKRQVLQLIYENK